MTTIEEALDAIYDAKNGRFRDLGGEPVTRDNLPRSGDVVASESEIHICKDDWPHQYWLGEGECDWQILRRAEQPNTTDKEEICRHCKDPVAKHTPTWWKASDDLWQKVWGGPDGILCAPCFTKAAQEKGITVHWQAVEYHPTPRDDVAMTLDLKTHKTDGVTDAETASHDTRPGTPINGLGRAFIIGSDGKVRDYLQRPRPFNPVIIGYECLHHDAPCPKWNLVEVEHVDGSVVKMHMTSACGG